MVEYVGVRRGGLVGRGGREGHGAGFGPWEGGRWKEGSWVGMSELYNELCKGRGLGKVLALAFLQYKQPARNQGCE